MLTWLTALAAHAAPLDGWENSRWLVEIEETLPTQFEIPGPDANAPTNDEHLHRKWIRTKASSEP